MSRRTRPAPFELGDTSVPAGKRAEAGLPIARLVTGEQVSLPVMVLHGATEGPTVWVSAAIHGDEVGGVEVVARLIRTLDPRRIAGTVLAVPIVNVHGFINGDRYLPDRRDLNRAFPGSARGSLAGQIAHLMMTEVVQRCSLGIDLHTGSDHRANLPQIRADLDDPTTRHLAHTFGAPAVIHAQLRDGSLRAAAREVGAKLLLYEAGEAWRFDEHCIRTGVDGTRRVLADLGMIEGLPATFDREVAESRRTKWVRARRSGILQFSVDLGDRVSKGEAIAAITDSFGRRLSVVRAPISGLVIGRTHYPLVNRGDALAHVADTDGDD